MTDRQMRGHLAPRLLSIPVGVPFLPTLADALITGRLVPGFSADADPLALASATIYLPTRRAARELRAIFSARRPGRAALLPSVRALGEFDEDGALFFGGDAAVLDLAPPIPAQERLLMLAPLVRAWKRRLPAHIAGRFAEEVVVPASTADALWFSRDLAALIDEVETEGAAWDRLGALVSADLAGWWQVTLDFLEIVTDAWPKALAARGQSDPAAQRSALIRAEAARLKRHPPAGPVIAAGSTGSIPATAELLAAIAHLPQGAVVLPGLDLDMDERAWAEITQEDPEPALLGHPQYGLARLLARIGAARRDVEPLGTPPPAHVARARLMAAALRPAETTDDWPQLRENLSEAQLAAALAGVTLLEAGNEREEAAAIAVALRLAVEEEGRRAALVTGDRELARRVSAELARFGIVADDSGGTPLAGTLPGELLRLLADAAFRPGDPVALLSLIKHPLIALGAERPAMRHAAETVELVALRGGTGRPDLARLAADFEARLAALAGDSHPPFWLRRLAETQLSAARDFLARLEEAVAPLTALRARDEIDLAEALTATVVTLEALARTAEAGLKPLYDGDAGAAMAEFLRGLLAATAPLRFEAREWPDVLEALIAAETVKPAPGADGRVAIWGTLEARLQGVDTLVVGALNEGSFPRRSEPDRFLSRLMQASLGLEPPERRIGLAAHDFQMAAGAPALVLSRALRAGDAPAVASRWLQRLLAFAGPAHAAAMRARGTQLCGFARGLDRAPEVPFAARPQPKPPLEARPRNFSVTEIETLRRDAYAVYARRILDLRPLDPLLGEPGARERGTLLHAVLERMTAARLDPFAQDTLERLTALGRAVVDEAALPPDIEAVWWPRLLRHFSAILDWERGRAGQVLARHAEARAQKTPVGETGITLSGFADRIDLLPGGMAVVLDFKTGSTPSKRQAHMLVAPQLALEGALLSRGAFAGLGPLTPSDLAYVRLKANGAVVEESILELGGANKSLKTAPELAEDAWRRLNELLERYRDPEQVYLSRALPFREGDTDGDYDHLARVLEWSAGGDRVEGGE